MGVIFTEKGNFNLNATHLAISGGRALGSIISKVQNLKEFGIKFYEKLYSSCVVPILDYQSSVRVYKDFNDIEAVQKRNIRYFLCVHRFAPKLAINGEVGWMAAKERRLYNILKYWNRLAYMSDNRICKKVLLCDYSICHNNWSSKVQDILETIGLSRRFENKTACNLPNVKV